MTLLIECMYNGRENLRDKWTYRGILVTNKQYFQILIEGKNVKIYKIDNRCLVGSLEY